MRRRLLYAEAQGEEAMTSSEDASVQTRREEMRTRSRDEAESILKLAGFELIHTWELANGYWPDSPNYDDVRRPWWLFMTQIGPVQIGWRKNVLHIQWSACKFRGIVTEDDVTKEPTCVHAWSVEKAITYMRELRKLATTNGLLKLT